MQGALLGNRRVGKGGSAERFGPPLNFFVSFFFQEKKEED